MTFLHASLQRRPRPPLPPKVSPVIDQPYLLVINIPLHCHDGRYWAEPLWQKDLQAHLDEIAALAIACPVVDAPPPVDYLAVSGIAVRPLPRVGRLAPIRLPAIAAALWRAIGDAAIVHTGIVGWPFPLGWVAIPIARLRRRKIVLVVESATWRIAPGASASLPARWRAAIWEAINRRAVAASDVTFFTSDAYRRELASGGNAHVLPAVWLDDEQLIDPARLAALAPGRRGRLLFSGRLTAAKGVAVLLDAIERSGIAVDIIGTGELADAVRAAATRRPDLVRLLDPIAYGEAFAALLDGYATLVVPTLTDEQPRVIFDAFARGLTVLASDTSGNRQVVADGRTGLLFAADDADALAAALRTAQAAPERLAAMGAAARAEMAGRTHAAMHGTRARLIVEALPDAV